MSNQELYSHVPPTKLRNIDEKFRPADTSAFWYWVADTVFFKMLENRFFSLKYKNGDFLKNREKGVPLIMFAPHNNWWDGIVGYNLIRRIGKKEFRIMVEELNRFPILRHCGCFSVNKKSPQASMSALKYAVEVTKDLNNIMYIFPQGIIMPPNYRPIELQTGLAYIAQNVAKSCGAVDLMPVGVNYMFLRADRPEVFVDLNKPIRFTDFKLDRKVLTHQLQEALTQACDNQFHDLSTGNVEGYETLFQQKLRWYKKIEKHLKKIEIRGSGV